MGRPQGWPSRCVHSRTMRLSLGLAVALLLLAVPGSASAGDLADSCAASSGDATVLTQGPCRGVEQVVSDGASACREAGAGDANCAQIPLSPHVVREEIGEYEKSSLHRTLAFQFRLANDIPFSDAPWPGTHNSFNRPHAPAPGASEMDPNQQLSLTDQLRSDMRSIELDLHWMPTAHSGGYDAVVCHGQDMGVGCSAEQPFSAVLPEVKAWLDKNPGQVLLLYLEDDLGGDEGHAAAANVLKDVLGSLVYPASKCTADCDARELPSTLTRADVLAAGAQVVIVDNEGKEAPEGRNRVFGWNKMHDEERPKGYANCQNAGQNPPLDYGRMIRFYEDSTWLTAQAEVAGQSSKDDGLRPDTVRAMVRCGVDLFGFDQLVPKDPRLDALAWSWAPGAIDDDASSCAVLGSDGRWRVASSCQTKRRAACASPTGGTWSLSPKAVSYDKASGACADAGRAFTAPRTGAQNAALTRAAPDG